MQTYKKWGVKFSYFGEGVRILRKLDLGTKVRGVNLVSGEKLCESEIVYRKREVHLHPLCTPLPTHKHTHPAYGAGGVPNSAKQHHT